MVKFYTFQNPPEHVCSLQTVVFCLDYLAFIRDKHMLEI